MLVLFLFRVVIRVVLVPGLIPTGWLAQAYRTKVCEAYSVHAVFLEMDSEIWQTLLYETLPTRVTEWSLFCFVFHQFFSLFFVFVFWVLGDPKIPSEKKKRRKKSVNGLTGTHRTRVQTIRIYLEKNGVRHQTFVRKTCVICLLSLYLVSV